MTTFAQAVQNQEVRTQNGMKAFKATENACTDLFFKIGASRGKDIIPDFVAALVENKDIALRIAQWVRDIRQGVGERQIFRDILQYLEKNDMESAIRLAKKVPDLGRFDDLFAFQTPKMQDVGFELVRQALAEGNGLAAKWTPRKGRVAEQFRQYLGWSPKFYRKTLVNLTKVVEQQMCSKQWEEINFSHVPSLAHARYKTAFFRNTPKYAEYVAKLKEGDKTVKVNAGAVYPYDVLKGVANLYYTAEYNQTQKDLIVAQWKALPNYVGSASILPMVDVSGSMSCAAGSKGSTTCMDVAVSLGLYLSEKNQGKFKDLFLTFSGTPELLSLKGDVVQRAQQMVKSLWNMNTNLHVAFDKVLGVAVKNQVPQSEMPEILLILSDMQFDHCAEYDHNAMQMIASKYQRAGYQVPKVVFWNLNANDNVPAKFNQQGVALISGFSPSIMKAVLSGDLEEFTPEAIMLKAVMSDRYSL